MRSYEDNRAHSRPSLTQFASIFDTSLHYVQKWDTNCFQVASQVLTAPDCFSFQAIGYFDLVKKCFFSHTRTHTFNLLNFFTMYYITNEETTHAGIWKMTKENTFFGYKVGDEYHWYKSKQTVKKHLKDTKIQFHRATKIKGEMYINMTYQTLTKW